MALYRQPTLGSFSVSSGVDTLIVSLHFPIAMHVNACSPTHARRRRSGHKKEGGRRDNHKEEAGKRREIQKKDTDHEGEPQEEEEEGTSLSSSSTQGRRERHREKGEKRRRNRRSECSEDDFVSDEVSDEDVERSSNASADSTQLKTRKNKVPLSTV